MLPLLFPWQAILSLTVTGNLQGADFIRGGPANDWIESFRPPGVPEFGGAESQYAEFDQIYNNAGITIRPPLDGRCLDFSSCFFTWCLSVYYMSSPLLLALPTSTTSLRYMSPIPAGWFSTLQCPVLDPLCHAFQIGSDWSYCPALIWLKLLPCLDLIEGDEEYSQD